VKRLLAFRFASALLAALLCVAAPGFAATPPPVAPAQASAGESDSAGIEQTLYVQAPDFADSHNSIVLVWLPEPLVSTCLGRTMKECSNIDYCIRTTNPNSSQCKNLGIPRSRLPHYPSNMHPRRAVSLVLWALGDNNGFGLLKDYYKHAPKESLERLSSEATIRARIRDTSTPSFEGFLLLQVLSVPAH